MIKSNYNPLISVVMSVYNGEKYLVEAIESILDQTYKNLEFIIVNDGSNDNSLEIISEFMKNDDRIILINRENKGLPYSLNEGISRAKGEYIARMDADDISLTSRIEKELRYLQENGLDVCGSYINVFCDKHKGRVVKYPLTHKEISVSLLFFSCLAHPSTLFKKDVFNKLKYNTNYKVAQDYQLWCNIINENFKIGNIPEVLLLYREHEAQAGVVKFKKQQDTAHEIALAYAEKLGNEEKKLIKSIIASKKHIELVTFKKLLTDVSTYLVKKGVSQEVKFEILKRIYLDTNQTSPCKYFYYRKITKEHDKLLLDELLLLLKSLLMLNKNSSFYGLLKKVSNYRKFKS